MSALITRLQRTLPKPVLFGLYGAIGALLGALILGEALWAALKPPPPPGPVLPPAAIRIAASETLGLNQGDKNQFTVRVVRDYFEGPVVLKCLDLPEGVTANEVHLDADQNDAELELVADTTAQVGEQSFKV
ncbi:MAG: von Willebrand factor type domain protein, partial [Planctomycetaceae bacterium]|nr:von Willebrand factor type domain protein [Planctomycetaceae bacterium]